MREDLKNIPKVNGFYEVTTNSSSSEIGKFLTHSNAVFNSTDIYISLPNIRTLPSKNCIRNKTF